MKYSLFLIALLSTLGLQAQGLTKEYDSSCDCEVVTNHYDNGQISAQYHQTMDGKRTGSDKSYYADGKLRFERNWENGVLHGESVHYHRNGNRYYNESYENGAKAGTWSFFDDQGDKLYDIEYANAESNVAYTYYSAGVIYLKQVMENGELVQEDILNQEIYNAKLEEAEAAKNAKK